MTVTKRFSLIKPTIQTPFQIDFGWWKQNDNNWRVHLQSCLCEEHQEVYENINSKTTIDWIDPVTAEVLTVDGLQHVLMTHCAQQPDFITSYTTLVDTVFRIFLANGNVPTTPVELASSISRTPQMILRTFAGAKVYKGIRPCIKTPTK